MLLLFIVALFSTIAFYRRAKQIGISPGRAASFPFVALGLFLAFSYVADRLLVAIASATDLRETTVTAIGFSFDLFLVIAYLKFVSRNWQALNENKRSV